MYHNELGWIDFEWGDTGKIKASGKTKGAMGISHIIESRMRKDNLSYEQATKMLTKNVVETIAKGKTVDKFEKGNVTALKIDHEKCRVSLRKSKAVMLGLLLPLSYLKMQVARGMARLPLLNINPIPLVLMQELQAKTV